MTFIIIILLGQMFNLWHWFMLFYVQQLKKYRYKYVYYALKALLVTINDKPTWINPNIKKHIVNRVAAYLYNSLLFVLHSPARSECIQQENNSWIAPQLVNTEVIVGAYIRIFICIYINIYLSLTNNYLLEFKSVTPHSSLYNGLWPMIRPQEHLVAERLRLIYMHYFFSLSFLSIRATCCAQVGSLDM